MERNGKRGGPTIRGGAKKNERMVCIMQEKCKGCRNMCSDRAKREEWRGFGESTDHALEIRRLGHTFTFRTGASERRGRQNPVMV